MSDVRIVEDKANHQYYKVKDGNIDWTPVKNDDEDLQAYLSEYKNCKCDLPYNDDGTLSGALELYSNYNQNCASSSGIPSCPIQMYDNYNNNILYGGTTPYTSGGYGTDYASMLGGFYGTGYCNNSYATITDDQLANMSEEDAKYYGKLRDDARQDQEVAYLLDEEPTNAKAAKIIEKMEKPNFWSWNGITGKDIKTIKEVYDNASPAEQEALRELYYEQTNSYLENDLEKKEKSRKSAIRWGSAIVGAGIATIGVLTGGAGLVAGAAIVGGAALASRLIGEGIVESTKTNAKLEDTNGETSYTTVTVSPEYKTPENTTSTTSASETKEESSDTAKNETTTKKTTGHWKGMFYVVD